MLRDAPLANLLDSQLTTLGLFCAQLGVSRMRNRALHEEAAKCRKMAPAYAGRPEEPFLLRLASAMEEMALVQPKSRWAKARPSRGPQA